MFRIDGLRATQTSIDRLAKSLDPGQVERAAEDSAKMIADDARRRAPRDEGTLQRAIGTTRLDRQGDQPAPVLARVDRKAAPHGHWVEFGTVKMAAQPYFRPAVMKMAGPAADRFEDALRRMVEGAV